MRALTVSDPELLVWVGVGGVHAGAVSATDVADATTAGICI